MFSIQVCASYVIRWLPGGVCFGSPLVVSTPRWSEQAYSASGTSRPCKVRPAEEDRRWETTAASGCPDSPRGSNWSLCSVVSLFRTYWSAWKTPASGRDCYSETMCLGTSRLYLNAQIHHSSYSYCQKCQRVVGLC